MASPVPPPSRGLRARTAAALVAAAAITALPAAAQVYTWEAAGIITNNAGVTPFPNGSPFNYRFTYDIADPNLNTHITWGASYTGPSSHALITVNGYQFESVPDEYVSLSVSRFLTGGSPSETVGFSAGDVTMPPGWSSPPTLSDSFGFFLQNAPPQGALTSIAPPTHFDLNDWVHFREFRMDFHDGVTFPGGSIATRATIVGQIQSITLVPTPATLPLIVLALVPRRRRAAPLAQSGPLHMASPRACPNRRPVTA